MIYTCVLFISIRYFCLKIIFCSLCSLQLSQAQYMYKCHAYKENNYLLNGIKVQLYFTEISLNILLREAKPRVIKVESLTR